jgi:hypothetical protein
MSSIVKLRLLWVILTITASIAGYLLLLHGGAYGDSAERNNQSTLIYQLEVYVGLVFIWPVTIYGWVRGLLGGSNILGLEVWLFQFFGYFIFYKIHAKIKFKST